jgi:hypothetical protein
MRSALLAQRARRFGLRLTPILVVAVAMLAAPSIALAGGFTAQLSAPTHRPKAGAPFRIEVTASRGSQRLSGTVRYQFYFDNQIVARKPGGSLTNGVFRDTLTWPASADGHNLWWQVVVTTRYGTEYLNWWIVAHS